MNHWRTGKLLTVTMLQNLLFTSRDLKHPLSPDQFGQQNDAISCLYKIEFLKIQNSFFCFSKIFEYITWRVEAILRIVFVHNSKSTKLVNEATATITSPFSELSVDLQVQGSLQPDLPDKGFLLSRRQDYHQRGREELRVFLGDGNAL